VTGDQEDVKEDVSDRYLHREVSRGAFERQFVLPREVGPGSTEAEHKEGVLRIMAKKTIEAEPKQRQIKVS
jgi:HSP20 family molecular chaperone IbpA